MGVSFFFSVGDITFTQEEVEEVVEEQRPVGPKSHIIFESSSESGSDRGKKDGGGDDDGGDGDGGGGDGGDGGGGDGGGGDGDGGDGDGADDDDDGDDDDDDDDAEANGRSLRSTYVGRGNVGDVRAARKRAGMSETFDKSDPLLTEFASFMKTAGGSQKDIANKVNNYDLL